MIIQGVRYPSDFEAKKGMIEIGRRMDEKGYAVAGDGSISVRVGPNAVWITAADADKGALMQDSFIRVDLAGKHMPGMKQARLPEDMPIHLKVYAENPAIRGILHGYPVEVTALAARGRGIEAAACTPALRRLGRIQVVSTEHMEACAQAVSSLSRTDSGVVLAQDGCMVWEESLMQAFHKMETMEYGIQVQKALATQPGPAACRPGPVQEYRPVYPDRPERPAEPERLEHTDRPDRPAHCPEIEGLTPLIRPGDNGSLPVLPEAEPVFAPKTTDAETRREQMMAEVVRRSMSAMR